MRRGGGIQICNERLVVWLAVAAIVNKCTETVCTELELTWQFLPAYNFLCVVWLRLTSLCIFLTWRT